MKLSAGRRSSLRRARRKAEEIGRVCCRMLSKPNKLGLLFAGTFRIDGARVNFSLAGAGK